jgi:hypothetical protein
MDEQKWKEHYSTCDYHKVWVKMMTEDGKHFFFHDYNEWYNVQDYCRENSVFIKDMHLQFRSHQCIIDTEFDVELPNVEGLYFVRSVMGGMGMKTKNYFTVGILKDNVVYKKKWLVPELIVEDEQHEQGLDRCFEEAMLYNDKKKKNRKE